MTEYAKNDGPLGEVPDIEVGASDAVLLTVSFAGFCVLAWSIYSIVIAKLKTARELEQEAEERETSYGERLAKADVSTLNRAQRRARAKHIMKQQRRVPAPPSVHQIANGGDRGEDPQHLLLQEQPHEEDIPPYEPQHANAQHLLSRKERQRAAKKVELQERKVLEESRRKEQRMAQEEAVLRKKEKEQQKALRAELDRKAREEQRLAEELQNYRAWKVFLQTEDSCLTVHEWILELKQNRIAYLGELAGRFRVDASIVHDRIQELIDASRISGILETSIPASSSSKLSNDEHGSRAAFVYISPDEMTKLASFVRTKDKITANEFATRIEELLQ